MMGTFFEQRIELDRAEMVARVLEIQTEACGYLNREKPDQWAAW